MTIIVNTRYDFFFRRGTDGLSECMDILEKQ